jgi:hypothetical protein
MKDAVAQHNKDLICESCGLKIERLSTMLTVEHLLPESALVP